MTTGAAMAPCHADVAFDHAFGGDLLADAARRALVGGAERLGLFGEGPIRLKFRHA